MKLTTMGNKKEIVATRIETTLRKLKEKDFTMFFYVVDSKNKPNNSMEYIYTMALTLKNKGYNVKMCYQLENEYDKKEYDKLMSEKSPIDENRIFVGVGKWLGKEYADIPHLNVAKDEWVISPQDFLFIPEALSSLMLQTYKRKIPCKRVVILQNFEYVTDYIPVNAHWATFGITDAISISDQQSKFVKSVFPYVKTMVLPPCVPDIFRMPVNEKKMVVNIITKNADDINRIIKPFYWRYPLLRFVTFRAISDESRADFAERLKESAITVWVDERTNIGLAAVEAIRCGNIVIGKIPDNIPEWMGDDTHIYDNGIWFAKMSQIPDILSSVITSWMKDDVPVELTDAMEVTSKMYRQEDWNTNIEKVFDELVNDRIKEIEPMLESVKNNAKKDEE